MAVDPAAIQFDAQTGLTYYAQARNSVGAIWNGSAFEAYATGNIATYAIPATEQGTASGYYTADLLTTTPGVYGIVAKQQVGGSPAESDPTVSTGQVEWNGTSVAYQADKAGYSLASSGLDAIATTAPAGVAGNFREMIVQTWRRFFKKVHKDGTTIKTYADNGTTVITTQNYTTTGSATTEDVGAAA